jgi:glycosyltransferase involved in cell wall biosynthesis/putative flippase GtrA
MSKIIKFYNFIKMNLRQEAPRLFNLLNSHKRPIKYLVAGGTATFVDLGLLFVLTHFLKFHYLVSSIFAFACAFFISFYLQKFWTFRDGDKKNIYKQMTKYLFTGLFNLGVNSLGMYVFVDHLHVMYMLAQIIMGILIAFINFTVYKFFIFNKKIVDPETASADKIKILIATGIFPPDIGGPAFMIEALANSLLANGILIDILTYADQGQTVEKKINKNGLLKIYRINRSRKALSHLIYFFWMLFLSFRADMIYVTDIYSVGYFAYLMKKIFKKKYIVRFAGDAAWEAAVANNWTDDYIVDFQKKKYDAKIEKLKARRKKIMVSADRVIAVSYFLAEIAGMIGVQDKNIKMIYNSVDFLDEKEINPENVKKIKEQFGQNAKIIITSCRLTRWKGVDGIIKAMPYILKAIGQVNFLVLGDGSEMDNLKRLAAEYKVAGNVFFLGRIDNNKVQDYIKAADLFILNTNYEGLSHALLGAMKAGTAIISSRAGGNVEVIEDGIDGLLFDYNDDKALAESATKVLASKEFADSLVDNANKKLEKFKWDNTVDLTVKTIKKVNCI